MPTPLVPKIISGGQTGVDRAALDLAIELEIPHGGWCPAGRKAEDGTIDEKYRLRETPSADYAVRTEQNVIDSDATLILYRDQLSGGTELTWKLAVKYGRPCCLVDLAAPAEADPARVVEWLRAERIGVRNVAGPRESGSPGIAAEVDRFLRRVFSSK